MKIIVLSYQNCSINQAREYVYEKLESSLYNLNLGIKILVLDEIAKVLKGNTDRVFETNKELR